MEERACSDSIYLFLLRQKDAFFAPTEKGNFAKKFNRPRFAPTLYFNDSSLQNLHLIYMNLLLDINVIVNIV